MGKYFTDKELAAYLFGRTDEYRKGFEAGLDFIIMICKRMPPNRGVINDKSI